MLSVDFNLSVHITWKRIDSIKNSFNKIKMKKLKIEYGLIEFKIKKVHRHRQYTMVITRGKGLWGKVEEETGEA